MVSTDTGCMNTDENVSTTIRGTTSRGTTSRGLHHLVDALRARRETRAADRRLAKQLASYTTRRELDELFALMERYDDAETADIRRVLGRRSTAA